ncbi:YezD family protein [Virgibacillus alimentarius]|uniref:DUF2292 domain-containing protein n=1 Tax=Virgibacillus alimentarius TaxID=698769 RepID=A0ABS4S9R8_9BACI|nr:YezD family protein [Virgibacillus alimentarius]MBP2258159.1 hypothetical protein [Virgibacillus alimentarius]
MSKLTHLQFEHIKTSLEKMKYGSIMITVQNGEITQIDTTEKVKDKRQPGIKTINKNWKN